MAIEDDSRRLTQYVKKYGNALLSRRHVERAFQTFEGAKLDHDGIALGKAVLRGTVKTLLGAL